jgi:hypothetical protein
LVPYWSPGTATPAPDRPPGVRRAKAASTSAASFSPGRGTLPFDRRLLIDDVGRVYAGVGAAEPHQRCRRLARSRFSPRRAWHRPIALLVEKRPYLTRGSCDPGRNRRAGWQSPRAAIPRPVAPARERRASDRHLRSIRRRSGRMVPRRMAALVTDALHHRTTRPVLARPALLVRIAQLVPKCLGCAGSWSTAENERQRL